MKASCSQPRALAKLWGISRGTIRSDAQNVAHLHRNEMSTNTLLRTCLVNPQMPCHLPCISGAHLATQGIPGYHTANGKRDLSSLGEKSTAKSRVQKWTETALVCCLDMAIFGTNEGGRAQRDRQKPHLFVPGCDLLSSRGKEPTAQAIPRSAHVGMSVLVLTDAVGTSSVASADGHLSLAVLGHKGTQDARAHKPTAEPTSNVSRHLPTKHLSRCDNHSPPPPPPTLSHAHMYTACLIPVAPKVNCRVTGFTCS